MAFTPITVTRRYVNLDLTPATGGVTLIPQVPMVNGNTVVAAPRGAALDAEGDLSIVVAANDDPATVPVGVSYLVREEIDRQSKREYYVVIPHDAPGGTVDLSSLVFATVPPTITYPIPGPQGPQGEQGIQGPTGAQGPAGIGFNPEPAVSTVADLPTTDPDGAARFVIENRHMYMRENGAWNDLGPLGVEGPTGPQGATGATGATGAPGADGRTVLNGTGAPSGGTGVNGDFYIDTAAEAIYGPKASGVWGSPTSLVGPTGATGSTGATGAPGADGRTVLNGAGAPSSGTGANGDFYIDTTASALYGPKAAGAWGSPTSLIGPQGPTGPSGGGGSSTIAGATDFSGTGAATGDLMAVTGTGPLAFGTTTKAGLPISTATQTALNGKEASITAGTTAQYWRGDKSWQTLDKTAVGLANVDNTSDANKPVSTATQTALNGKQALDSDLTAIAALDASTAGAIASDGAGWIKKTYAQLKTALALVASDVGLGNVANAAQVQLSTIAAKGDLLVGTAAATIAALTVGANGRVLSAASSQTSGLQWHANPTPTPVTLTDGATITAPDASQGRVFKLSAAGDRTIPAPTNSADGRGFIIKHTASGANRTLTLATGSAGSFQFGSDITALTATTSGLTDYIGCIYDTTADRWRVVSYVKGFA